MSHILQCDAASRVRSLVRCLVVSLCSLVPIILLLSILNGSIGDSVFILLLWTLLLWAAVARLANGRDEALLMERLKSLCQDVNNELASCGLVLEVTKSCYAVDDALTFFHPRPHTLCVYRANQATASNHRYASDTEQAEACGAFHSVEVYRQVPTYFCSALESGSDRSMEPLASAATPAAFDICGDSWSDFWNDFSQINKAYHAACWRMGIVFYIWWALAVGTFGLVTAILHFSMKDDASSMIPLAIIFLVAIGDFVLYLHSWCMIASLFEKRARLVEQYCRTIRHDLYLEIHTVSRMDPNSGFLRETEYLRLFPSCDHVDRRWVRMQFMLVT
jgi:hypothetical protein